MIKPPSPPTQPNKDKYLYPEDPLIVTLQLLLVLEDWVSAFLLSRMHYWQKQLADNGLHLDEHGTPWVAFSEAEWVQDLYEMKGCGKGAVSSRLAQLVEKGALLRRGAGKGTAYAVNQAGLLQYAQQKLGFHEGLTIESLLEPGEGRQVRVVHPRLVTRETGLNFTQAAIVQEIHYYTRDAETLDGLIKSAFQWLDGHFPFLNPDKKLSNRVKAMHALLSALERTNLITRVKDSAFNGDHTYTHFVNRQALSEIPAPGPRETVDVYWLWKRGLGPQSNTPETSSSATSSNQKSGATHQNESSATEKAALNTTFPDGHHDKNHDFYIERRLVDTEETCEAVNTGSAQPSRGCPEGGDDSFKKQVNLDYFLAVAPSASLIARQFGRAMLSDILAKKCDRLKWWGILTPEQVEGCVQRVESGHHESKLNSRTQIKHALDSRGQVEYDAAETRAREALKSAADEYASMATQDMPLAQEYEALKVARDEFFNAHSSRIDDIIGMSKDELIQAYCKQRNLPYKPLAPARQDAYAHAAELGVLHLITRDKRQAPSTARQPLEEVVGGE